MNRIPKFFVILIVLGAALAAALWWMKPAQPPAPQASDLRPSGPAASVQRAIELTQGEVTTVSPTRIARSVPITGTLNAVEQTVVKSRVSGDIRDIRVREGMSVRAGELVATIDPLEFELKVSEREALLRSAEAQLEQARRTLLNNQALLEKNFISQNAFDNARWSVDIAMAARDSALSQLAQARKSLADTRVLAPMAGVVAQRFVQPGEKVSPDNRIISIVDLSRMEIECPVPAGDVGSIRIGQPITLHIEGVEAAQTGTVLRISPSAQAGTRSITVFIGLGSRDGKLRAGLFAQGSLTLEQRDGVLAVPAASIRDQAGRRFVYAIEAGHIVEREIKSGLLDEAARAPNGAAGMIEITAGLKSGDRIVAVNLGALRPGAAVNFTTPR